VELDRAKFEKMFVDLMARATPGSKAAGGK